MSKQKPYPTDLKDAEWERLERLLPDEAKSKHSARELLNAILYVTRNGCIWGDLPHDFPPYKTVHDYYRKLCRRGVWQPILGALREPVRVEAGRDAHPSIVVLDRQSSKTTEKGATWA